MFLFPITACIGFLVWFFWLSHLSQKWGISWLLQDCTHRMYKQTQFVTFKKRTLNATYKLYDQCNRESNVVWISFNLYWALHLLQISSRYDSITTDDKPGKTRFISKTRKLPLAWQPITYLRLRTSLTH